MSILDGFISCKIYNKPDNVDFEIVNFPYLDGDVPRRASYGVYISQLIRFATVSSHVSDFSTRNKLLTAKLLNQGYRNYNLHKAFFLNFIDVISIEFQSSMLDLNRFCNKAYRNLNFMVT